MDEWEGKCAGCLRIFRIQLKPGSRPHSDRVMVIDCPFCRPGIYNLNFKKLEEVRMVRTQTAERYHDAIT